jgi:uncharacterized protein YeaO (DUF488 family)
MAVDIVRVYDKPPKGGATRILVDRLWPRGVGKDTAPIDEWNKEVAPSTELRRWYGHEPERFAEFRTRYRAELHAGAAHEAFEELRQKAESGDVVLVTATRDVQRSAAAVLKGLLTKLTT